MPIFFKFLQILDHFCENWKKNLGKNWENLVENFAYGKSGKFCKGKTQNFYENS